MKNDEEQWHLNNMEYYGKCVPSEDMPSGIYSPEIIRQLSLCSKKYLL